MIVEGNTELKKNKSLVYNILSFEFQTILSQYLNLWKETLV